MYNVYCKLENCFKKRGWSSTCSWCLCLGGVYLTLLTCSSLLPHSQPRGQINNSYMHKHKLCECSCVHKHKCDKMQQCLTQYTHDTKFAYQRVQCRPLGECVHCKTVCMYMYVGVDACIHTCHTYRSMYMTRKR